MDVCRCDIFGFSCLTILMISFGGGYSGVRLCVSSCSKAEAAFPGGDIESVQQINKLWRFADVLRTDAITAMKKRVREVVW